MNTKLSLSKALLILWLHTVETIAMLILLIVQGNGAKAIRTQTWRPLVLQEVEPPEFLDNWHMKVVRLSSLRTSRLYPPGDVPGTHFCYRLSQPQGHSATGRIKSMKSSNDPFTN
jgi:hypothetical protein